MYAGAYPIVREHCKQVLTPHSEKACTQVLTWRTSGWTLNALAQSGCNLVNAAVDCFNVAAEDKNILTSGCSRGDKTMMVQMIMLC